MMVDLEKALDYARWLLLLVISIKAGEAYSGQYILPQNPLDIGGLVTNLISVDVTTMAVILGTFLFLTLIIVALKKKKRSAMAREVIYVPVSMPTQTKTR